MLFVLETRGDKIIVTTVLSEADCSVLTVAMQWLWQQFLVTEFYGSSLDLYLLMFHGFVGKLKLMQMH